VEKKRSPPISATTEHRCVSALKHIDQGLRFLSSLESKREKREAEIEKEKERVERENLKMSVPNKPIPMGYTSNSVIQRTRSVSEGCVANLKPKLKELTWTEYLKFLLLKKSVIVYITIAEVYFNKKHFGKTLKCIKRAMNCHSMLICLGGEEETHLDEALSFALGVAGDCYMACVSSWDSMPVYQEQYNTALPAGNDIMKEIEKYTTELDRDWTIKQPRDIREGMELAMKCYTKASEIARSADTSLIKRLANVENELGVFYMNQATALVQKINDNQELAVTAMAGAQDLFKFSRKYLNQGISKFKSISDISNTALLLSNSGRLSRLAGHAAGLQAGQDGPGSEFGGEEAKHYKVAVEYYHQALSVLGSKKENIQIWDTISWELSSTLFTIGTLLQDHAPLSTQSRDEVEKSVTDYMSQSLKYCDVDNPSPRQHMYQTRAAVIHHRLASLYHHSFRCYESDDNSSRKKKLKQLSELHYSKASQLFLTVERPSDYLRTILERAGLVEAQLTGIKGEGLKYKMLLQVLDVILETEIVITKLANQEYEEIDDNEDTEEIMKMVETVLQRIQFTLLSMIKLGNVSTKTRKSKTDKKVAAIESVKETYAAALKCSSKSPTLIADLQALLSKIVIERGAM